MTSIDGLSGDFDVTIPLWDVSKYATSGQSVDQHGEIGDGSIHVHGQGAGSSAACPARRQT